jgi:hypothetical protein
MRVAFFSATCGEGEMFMAHIIDYYDPEHVIAILNRNRHLKVVA